MKTLKVLIILIIFAACQQYRPVKLRYDNQYGVRYYYVTVNDNFIDTTATFNYQRAYKYYIVLKKRYKQTEP